MSRRCVPPAPCFGRVARSLERGDRSLFRQCAIHLRTGERPESPSPARKANSSRKGDVHDSDWQMFSSSSTPCRRYDVRERSPIHFSSGRGPLSCLPAAHADALSFPVRCGLPAIRQPNSFDVKRYSRTGHFNRPCLGRGKFVGRREPTKPAPPLIRMCLAHTFA